MTKLTDLMTEDEIWNLRAFAKGQTSFASLTAAEKNFVNAMYEGRADVEERGGRDLPFQRRHTVEDFNQAAGIDDPALADLAYGNIRDAEITSTLLQPDRMGSDADLPPDTRPPTLAETLEAALEAHDG